MADPVYKDYPFLFASKGVVARKVDDTLSGEEYLDLDNAEELAENALSQRLGSVIVNKAPGVGIDKLGYPISGSVVSLAKLAGLNGSSWRYAVGSDGTLWRLTGLGPGPYTEIEVGLTGAAVQTSVWCPDAVSTPYLYLADGNMMLKDNGSFAAPQNMGILQPRYPVLAQVQAPTMVLLDNYRGSASSYAYSGLSVGSIVSVVSTTVVSIATRVLADSINGSTVTVYQSLAVVTVASMANIRPFQVLVIDAGTGVEETVMVLSVTTTSFTARVNNSHSAGATVTSSGLQVSVAASTTATVSLGFGSLPVSTWPVTLSPSDYIAFNVYVTNPTSIQSITLKFDCGDGTFHSDYFYKVIGQGPLAGLLSTATSGTTDPTTAATDVLLTDSLGLFNNSSTGISPLSNGINSWTLILQQLSDFAGAGHADFNDPVFNWSNINGYQIQIVTNTNSSVTMKFSGLVLFGGAGPDSLGGVGYDYRCTWYNANDQTESNPSQEMTNVNPPNMTNWVYPRRMPVSVFCNLGNSFIPISPDPQATHVRIYRRGGTLGDAYRRVDQIPVVTGSSGNIYSLFYSDVTSDSDLASADILSFTNDVPVTSSLPGPVNTTLTFNLTSAGPNADTTVNVVSTAGISNGQLITIGSPTSPANNFEIAVVTAVFGSSTQFYASVQNSHSAGEAVQATAQYGKPVTGMVQAYGKMYYWGDSNNPHYLYFSEGNKPQAVGSANYVEVGTPDDGIVVALQFKGNLYVSTRKFWWAIAPGVNGTPTVYPTASKHGCVARLGYVVTESGIFYQAVDGIRFFAGGASEYLTQNLEFIFQGVGSTPITPIDQTQLALTVMAYWNNMIFVSYVGVDAKRHRLIYHTIYQRWRNDDQDAWSLLLEADTNALLYGDTAGYVHVDRQSISFDDAPTTPARINAVPISMTIQSGYNNQGAPDIQKNYQELTLDVNTNGQDLTVALVFDDGQATQSVGIVNTSQRQKVNFNLNSGIGFTYYKASLLLSAAWSAFGYIYQGSIKALPLAKTRKSMDTFWLRLSHDSNKIAKDTYWEYTSTTSISVSVYYDGSATAGFTFTLPNSVGVRNSIRQRLPSTSFKMIRFVATATADFQVWGDETVIECKPLGLGKGYQKMPFMPN